MNQNKIGIPELQAVVDASFNTPDIDQRIYVIWGWPNQRKKLRRCRKTLLQKEYACGTESNKTDGRYYFLVTASQDDTAELRDTVQKYRLWWLETLPDVSIEELLIAERKEKEMSKTEKGKLPVLILNQQEYNASVEHSGSGDPYEEATQVLIQAHEDATTQEPGSEEPKEDGDGEEEQNGNKSFAVIQIPKFTNRDVQMLQIFLEKYPSSFQDIASTMSETSRFQYKRLHAAFRKMLPKIEQLWELPLHIMTEQQQSLMRQIKQRFPEYKQFVEATNFNSRRSRKAPEEQVSSQEQDAAGFKEQKIIFEDVRRATGENVLSRLQQEMRAFDEEEKEYTRIIEEYTRKIQGVRARREKFSAQVRSILDGLVSEGR